MGSNYFGDSNMGNERSGSSRKGKKSNSDKPKQPQRGLGVAQLEKIRLHSQMACNYLPSVHNPYSSTLNQEDMRLQTAYSSSPSSFSSSSSYAFPVQQNFTIGLGDMERANIRFPDSQPSIPTRWHPGAAVMESQQHFVQPSITRQYLLNLQAEEELEKRRKKGRSNSLGSTSQNSESSGNQELDLELRLSLG